MRLADMDTLDTGTGLPVGLVLAQCTNIGQVLARGGQVSTNGNCVQSQTQQVMSAVPILDNEDGTLEIKLKGGKQYVKVYDPLLNATRWQAWTLPLNTDLVPLGGEMAADKSLLSKLGDLVSSAQQVVVDHNMHAGPGRSPTTPTNPVASSSPDTTPANKVQGEEVAPSDQEENEGKEQVVSTSTQATSCAPRLAGLATTASITLLVAALILII